jgi:hypothetical protein
VDGVVVGFADEGEIFEVGGPDGVFEQVVPPDDTK